MPENERKKVVIEIEGMHCAACAAAVEHKLSELDGVFGASVNLVMNSAAVEYDPSTVGVDAMHARIRALGFEPVDGKGKKKEDGSCQKVNKALTENRTARRKFIVAVCFSAALMLVSMGGMRGLPLLAPLSSRPLVLGAVELLLLLPVLAAGREIFARGAVSALHRAPGMDTLVALGCASCVAYSLVLMIITASGGRVFDMLYFESAGMILSFILLGRWLEDSSRRKTTAAVDALAALAPDEALLRTPDGEKRIPSEDIAVGDIIIVKPGMSVPADGEVVSGSAFADESMLTGESMPSEKLAGSKVFSGTLVSGGMLVIRAEKTAGESAVAGIARAVRDAQSRKAPVSRLADRVAAKFVPAVLVVALAACAVWLLVGGGVPFAFNAFVSVLVVACPCALGLATPTAVVAAVGAAAKRGILFRSGEAVENAKKIELLFIDKTGTLTRGEPCLAGIYSPDEDEASALAVAASAEAGSAHPIAAAIIDAANERGIEIPAAEEFTSIEGRGVSAVVNGDRVLLGNAALMAENGVDISAVRSAAESFASGGGTVMYCAHAGRVSVIAVSDAVRRDSREAVEALKARGVRTVMLTGDGELSARAMAEATGVDEYYAGLLPEEKLVKIGSMSGGGTFTAMVGDGINDAPALAGADIGISVGSTDIAVLSSDIILTGNSLLPVAEAMDISSRAMRIIKQNLFWAFLYNFFSIPAAAGVFYALGGAQINPSLAAAAMSASSVLVVLNSLRLAKKQNRHRLSADSSRENI